MTLAARYALVRGMAPFETVGEQPPSAPVVPPLLVPLLLVVPLLVVPPPLLPPLPLVPPLPLPLELPMPPPLLLA
jgi:hypothetical protein